MAGNRKVTLNDIAEACGVSRATVSLVLRNSPLVHADTRQRVKDEMRRQGYVYNRAAAGLRTRTSSSIALVVNDLSNPFFAEFAAGVDEALAAAGFVTLLGSSGESAERQQAVLSSLVEYHPAAIILSPAEVSDVARIAQAIGPSTPLLVFNRQLTGESPADFSYDFLGLDNRAGARRATEHLLQLGHRRIAFFGGHQDSSSCRERRLGYLDAMTAAGIKPEPQWTVECSPTRLEAAAQTSALFVRDPAPTAAVCYNDAVALGLALGLARRGRHPGHDFAICGFDDIPEAAASTPPLTTISVEPRERGRQAAMLALQRAREPTAAPARVIAPVQLIERSSTCPPVA